MDLLSFRQVDEKRFLVRARSLLASHRNIMMIVIFIICAPDAGRQSALRAGSAAAAALRARRAAHT